MDDYIIQNTEVILWNKFILCMKYNIEPNYKLKFYISITKYED